MSRISVANKMIEYLQDSANCEKAMMLDGMLGKLRFEDNDISYFVLEYSDDSETHDKTWIEKIYKLFDFYTEANYTGFDYFPYIYGVLDCHFEKKNDDDSRVYLYYEYLPNALTQQLDDVEHDSNWYDIVFQLMSITNYIQNMCPFSLSNDILKSMYCIKLEKPYTKMYVVNNIDIPIKHKYSILYWDLGIKTISSINMVKKCADELISYIENNTLTIPASNRIVQILNAISMDPSDLANILVKYYAPKSDNNNLSL